MQRLVIIFNTPLHLISPLYTLSLKLKKVTYLIWELASSTRSRAWVEFVKSFLEIFLLSCIDLSTYDNLEATSTLRASSISSRFKKWLASLAEHLLVLRVSRWLRYSKTPSNLVLDLPYWAFLACLSKKLVACWAITVLSPSKVTWGE